MSKHDSSAYLFRLRRNGDLNNSKFKIQNEYTPAITYLSYYGPTFGTGHDIFMQDDPTKTGSLTRFCSSY